MLENRDFGCAGKEPRKKALSKAKARKTRNLSPIAADLAGKQKPRATMLRAAPVKLR